MKRIIVVAVILLLFTNLYCEGKYRNEDFIGLWYFIDGDQRVDVKQSVTIEMTQKGLLVYYCNGKDIFSGVLVLTSDGRNLNGFLNGLGGVVIGKVRSLSEIENNGIYLDLSGGPDDILLGCFQSKRVLEKLLKIQLPNPK
jgi:hypothetical protein